MHLSTSTGSLVASVPENLASEETSHQPRTQDAVLASQDQASRDIQARMEALQASCLRVPR